MYTIQTVVNLRLDDIVESRVRQAIHPDIDLQARDAWLLENIQQYGILQPVLVTPGGSLIDGHRRLACARHLQLATIPACVIEAGDEAFASAQLSRQLTIYAKCVLYREQIGVALAQGKAARKAHLLYAPGDSGEDDGQLWIRLEESLGTNRQLLSKGARLLDKLDEMRDNGENPDKIARLTHIFRNRGVGPARRMLGETTGTTTPTADEPVDCALWGGDTRNKSKPTKKRRRVHTPSAEEATEDEPSTKELARKDKWEAEVLRLFEQIELILLDNFSMTPELREQVDNLKNEFVTMVHTAEIAAVC